MIRAFIISIPDHPISQAATRVCIQSINSTASDLTAEIAPAVTPATMSECKWTWPLRKKHICPLTGLLLSAYKNYIKKIFQIIFFMIKKIYLFFSLKI